MSIPNGDLLRTINALRGLRANIHVPFDFHARMRKINVLLSNDKTGIVATLMDFMVNCASVQMNIETHNSTLDANLSEWQKVILNRDISPDIPRGLKALSAEYFKERWKSSFVALNVVWEDVAIGGDVWNMPTKMWFADGSAIKVQGGSTIESRVYTLGTQQNSIPLVNTKNQSVIIRKPYNSWYDVYPTPFLVKRGVLFNALLKEAIITKQADIIEAIIPYLLLLKAGSDKLAEIDMLAGQPELDALKKQFTDVKNENDVTGQLSKSVAALNYDVNVEHLMPDLAKAFDAKITQAADRNILAGMGLIELEGFSKNRQETILNPKVLVEEVKSAVQDWASILEEIMYQMLLRNAPKHPKLSNGDVRVLPGVIRGFLTADLRDMIRSLYDRGVVSKQSYVESESDFDFEIEVERRDKETADGLDKKLYPPVIQNQERQTLQLGPDGLPLPVNPATPDPKLENQNKKPGTPEVNKFKKAEELSEYVEAPYKKVTDLPKSIKDSLPAHGQLIWLKAFNNAISEGKDETSAHKIAWANVEKIYEKNADGKWVKK